jgi:hypothetical protein
MSGHDPLSKHERQVGYLKMTISLQLGHDRDVVDDTLHPMNGVGARLLMDWSGAITEFINELGH